MKRLAPLLQTRRRVVLSLPSSVMRTASAEGYEAILLTSPRSRPHVRSAIARNFPQVRVISYAELAPQVQVEVVRQLSAVHGESVAAA